MKNQYWYYMPYNKLNTNNKNNYRYIKNNNKLNFDFFDLGDKAPNFTLQGIVDGEPKNISLSDYQGKWVLLFFYGSDFTFV